MKFIKKSVEPSFFTTDVSAFTTWDEYYGYPKIRLKKHMLEQEQYWLCCYCEKQIKTDGTSSHIEHLKPKSLDIDTLTFKYANLVVSCQGNHCNEDGFSKQHFCGHKKDNLYNELLLLDPTKLQNISEYFAFEEEDGSILPSNKDETKAIYTIQLLNLNGDNNRLAIARKIVLKALIKVLGELNLSSDDIQKYLKNTLNDESQEYVTFLRYVLIDLA